ncbi:MAG TPA: (d)CMP kinase [Pyrinomonadaceae bacterium]|nr:(d)CMP kinase [Pyrinomonadaceae bacterium]
MIVSIDGPSGAGKSTLGKMLAKSLGLLYVDSGAMYRAVALGVVRRDIGLNESDRVAEVARSVSIELRGEPDNLRVLLDGEDVTSEIRTVKIAQAASVVSTNSDVRFTMVQHQRKLGLIAPSGCVLEGRDIGSVVFPNADLKFFLTATPEARARRRFQEDSLQGRAVSYEQTLAEINERDHRDVSRQDSPLTIPDNAVVIDTSELDLTEVFGKMIEAVKEKESKSK